MEVTDQLITMPSNLSLVNDVEMEVGDQLVTMPSNSTARDCLSKSENNTVTLE